MQNHSIAIIGAGFCGTMTAINLARRVPAAAIALIEQNPIHGPGLAYGTADPGHLLNVRAGQMSAFPDNPDDFYNWLASGAAKSSYAPTDFVPRKIYGKYLRRRLAETRAAHPNLSLLNRRITSIRRAPSGFELLADDGASLVAEKIVLALGNFPPDQIDGGETQNPYAPEISRQLADDGDILIVGTGLTSLDLIVTLARTKPAGKIHLLSRHGLLPREHAETAFFSPGLDAAALPTTALALLRAVRKEVATAAKQNLSWHSAIDALRPLNQNLWQALEPAEKQRFFRHLRAYWDVHRHRCAPEIMNVYRALANTGRILLHPGSIISQTRIPTGWRVKWRQRGADDIASFDVRHIVRCTGPQSDFRKLPDPLVQNLLETGLITPDALRLGIATDQDYTVIGAQGRTASLYALGSVLKGRLYESVAVPELRIQASELAERLSRPVH